MKSLIHTVENLFSDTILEIFPDLEQFPSDISPASQEKFGHYQFNGAMKLTKILKISPRQIAEKIVEKLSRESLERVEIAGPGFINVTFSSEFLSEKLNEMLRSSKFGIEPPKHPQRIIVEFSSPNIAKELHVGHLRSTIIGDSLARLFEFLGHDVLRLNHVGDWGTAFGMLITHMKEKAPEVLTGKVHTDLSHLVKWYKESKGRFDRDAEFKKRSQLEVVALQGGDPEAFKAWKIICETSREAFQEIYDLLDVKLIERGESFYNPMLADLIKDLESKGLIVLSDGAKCVYLDGFTNREGNPLPLMVQKSDGGYNYDTTDMAALRHRIEEEKAERIIIVTDAGQSLHFQMVFKTAEKAGYLEPENVRMDHVTFGLVLGPDGKKFKTREGETERLIDLLNNAIKKAREIVEEKNPSLSNHQKEHLAHVLGIGAVKYADLSSNRLSDYTFSYERMLRFEGNTAVFLLYSYVRVSGIKRKVDIQIEEIIQTEQIQLNHPSEIKLGLHLARFQETLQQLTEDLMPNRLTDYLYALAEKFNAFFRDCRVEGSPEQTSRLLLCELVAKTLKQGLDILGVQTVDRM